MVNKLRMQHFATFLAATKRVLLNRSPIFLAAWSDVRGLQRTFEGFPLMLGYCGVNML